MEFMGALCCGLPTLIALAILYFRAPSTRRGIHILVGVGGCFFLMAIGWSLHVWMRDDPVLQAAKAGDVNGLRLALDAGGSANAGSGDDASLSALKLAIDSGNLGSVELLLKRGADPNEPSGPETPIDRARLDSRTDLVRLLQRYGAY